MKLKDIAEEIIRMWGYNKLPSKCIYAETTQGGRNDRQTFEVKLEQAMCAMGLSQIHTFSFISPRYYDKIRLPSDSPLRTSVVIRNPLGEDTSVMRTILTPQMVEVMGRNYSRNLEAMKAFEIGIEILNK